MYGLIKRNNMQTKLRPVGPFLLVNSNGHLLARGREIHHGALHRQYIRE